MTLTFAVDATNDLFLDENGNIAMRTDLLAVQDICLGAVKAQLGEMVYFTNQGLPNFQTVWSGVPNIPQFQAALRETILSVENVLQVTSLSTVVNGRVLSYAAVILTTYGQAEINGATGI